MQTHQTRTDVRPTESTVHYNDLRENNTNFTHSRENDPNHVTPSSPPARSFTNRTPLIPRTVRPSADSAVKARARWTNHTPVFRHLITLPSILARRERGQGDERAAFAWSGEGVVRTVSLGANQIQPATHEKKKKYRRTTTVPQQPASITALPDSPHANRAGDKCTQLRECNGSSCAVVAHSPIARIPAGDTTRIYGVAEPTKPCRDSV